MYHEDELLPLSALQHLIFCERQCALIHIEQVWNENALTAQGRALHERVHEEHAETRAGVRTEFGLAVRSLELGLSGKCDAVEFRDAPYPVEYKRGRPKQRNMDEVQLCAQALCLEEMLGVPVPVGALFYGKKRRRKEVFLDGELRSQTRAAAGRLHEMFERGVTPPPVYSEFCGRCSLREACLPEILSKRRDVERYVERTLTKDIGGE